MGILTYLRRAQNFGRLVDGASYRVRFPNADGPRDGAEFVDMLHPSGYWLTGCEAYTEGPLGVAEADYEIVGWVDAAP